MYNVTTIGRYNGAMPVLLDLSAAFDTIYHDGFKENNIQVVELSGRPDLQIVVNTSLHTVSSTVSGVCSS